MYACLIWVIVDFMIVGELFRTERYAVRYSFLVMQATYKRYLFASSKFIPRHIVVGILELFMLCHTAERYFKFFLILFSNVRVQAIPQLVELALLGTCSAIDKCCSSISK